MRGKQKQLEAERTEQHFAVWNCRKVEEVCLNLLNIIEQGPPEELVATFHKLFDEKIKKTKSLATQAAKQYGLLPGLLWQTQGSAASFA